MPVEVDVGEVEDPPHWTVVKRNRCRDERDTPDGLHEEWRHAPLRINNGATSPSAESGANEAIRAVHRLSRVAMACRSLLFEGSALPLTPPFLDQRET